MAAMTKEQYQAEKAARTELTTMATTVMETSQPTPTQEENDLLRLGLMHPDEKASTDSPQMPPLGAQQAYVEGAVEGHPTVPAPKLVRPPPQAKPATSPSPEPITVSRGPGRPPGSGASQP